MPIPHDHLDRFLRAVRLRWTVVRVAESVGLAVLGGCGICLVLVPIQIWVVGSGSAMPFIGTVAAVAVAAGAVNGLFRRPGLLSAAREADRQLDLADLLSTALTTRARSSADPWAHVVIATADARCRALKPNTVVINRYGGRAWGGIGLAAALVVTLGLMSANPQPTGAVAVTMSPIDSVYQPRTPAPEGNAPRAGETSRTQRRPGSPGDAAERLADVDAPGGTPSNEASARQQAGSASERGGAGLSTSPQRPNAVPPSQAPPSGTSPTDDNGSRAGGGTELSPAPPGDDGNGGMSVASSPTGQAPAWASQSWPAARDEALSAVRDGRVSDAYRDLVRTYFDDSAAATPATPAGGRN